MRWIPWDENITKKHIVKSLDLIVIFSSYIERQTSQNYYNFAIAAVSC